jgi:hypothetical protein
MTEIHFVVSIIVSGLLALLLVCVADTFSRARQHQLNAKIDALDKAVSEGIKSIFDQVTVLKSTIAGYDHWFNRNVDLGERYLKLAAKVSNLAVNDEIRTTAFTSVAAQLENLASRLAELQQKIEAQPLTASLTDEEKAEIKTQACRDALRQAALALMAEASSQPRRYVSTTPAIRMPVSVHKATDILLQQGSLPRTLQVGHANCDPQEVLDLITAMSAWVCTNTIPQLKGESHESGTQEVQARSEHESGD